MKTFIIPTSTTEHLIKRIKSKDLKIILPDKNKEGKRYFPDGEIYMKISKVNKLKNKRVIVLHSGSPKPNEGLVELELILQILKDNNVKPEIFFTYFPYGMQDKVFEKGETNTAESLIKKLINYYRVKKIYVIDPHFGGRNWVKKYYTPYRQSGKARPADKGPLITVSAVPLLIKKAEKDFGLKAKQAPNRKLRSSMRQARCGANKNILFLSPDKGGKRRTGISGIKKERLGSFKVKYLSPKIFFSREIIGVVDDIIETGGTLLRFFDFVKKSKAKKIIVLANQGVLSTGIAKIKKKYFKLYLTNAVKQKEANVDIADLILKTISS